jgi:glutamyl-tRNA(Gln) amidotransferase subunit E
MPEDKLRRFMTDYQLNEKLARQIVNSEYMTLFEDISRDYSNITTLTAVTLTEDVKKLERDGLQIANLSDETFKEIFKLISEEKTLKESIPTMLTWLAINSGKGANEALKILNLEILTKTELENIIEKKLKDNFNLVKKMGDKAAAPLMSIVMSEVRGKAKASDVQQVLKQKIEEYKIDI